jgi:uncharacterized Zn-finger protein
MTSDSAAPDPFVPEIILVETKRVKCDGGGGALGHPLVWYDLGDDGVVDCGYCDRRFVLKGGPADPDRAR